MRDRVMTPTASRSTFAEVVLVCALAFAVMLAYATHAADASTPPASAEAISQEVVDQALALVTPLPQTSILWVDSAGNLGFRPGPVTIIYHAKQASIPDRCRASVERNAAEGAVTLCMPDASLWQVLGGD